MGQHGHQGAGYAMAGAVDHAEQTAVVVGAIDIEVTTNDIARPPRHRMAIAHGADQLPVRQDRALDEAGVIDGVVDLLVCRGHVPVACSRSRVRSRTQFSSSLVWLRTFCAMAPRLH